MKMAHHYLVAVVTLLSVLATACTTYAKSPVKATNAIIQMDSVMVDKINDTICSAILKPNKVEIFKMSTKKVTPSDERLGMYVVDSLLCKLDRSYYSIFQFYLSDHNNFIFDTSASKAYFEPTYAIRFTKGKDIISVIVALNCNQLSIIHNDIERIRIQTKNPRFIVSYLAAIFRNDYIDFMMSHTNNDNKEL